MTSASSFLMYQTRGFQHLKMLGYGRAADGQPVRQFADGGRPLSEQIEHSLPGGIRESSQQLLCVSHILR